MERGSRLVNLSFVSITATCQSQLQAHFFCNDAALDFVCAATDHGGLVALYILLWQSRIAAESLQTIKKALNNSSAAYTLTTPTSLIALSP